MTTLPLNGLTDRCTSAVNDLQFGLIVETVDLAASYARSASEAGWRGDTLTLGVHLRQLPLCVIAAIQTFKELGGEGRRESGGLVSRAPSPKASSDTFGRSHSDLVVRADPTLCRGKPYVAGPVNPQMPIAERWAPLPDDFVARPGTFGDARRSTLRFKSVSAFCAEYVPLAYVIEGIVRSGSLYTLTAKTGSGKTALAVIAALAVVTGR
jgi:hypothetical protein